MGKFDFERVMLLLLVNWQALSKENVGNIPYCPCPKTVSVFRSGLLDMNIKIFSIPENELDMYRKTDTQSALTTIK